MSYSSSLYQLAVAITLTSASIVHAETDSTSSSTQPIAVSPCPTGSLIARTRCQLQLPGKRTQADNDAPMRGKNGNAQTGDCRICARLALAPARSANAPSGKTSDGSPMLVTDATLRGLPPEVSLTFDPRSSAMRVMYHTNF